MSRYELFREFGPQGYPYRRGYKPKTEAQKERAREYARRPDVRARNAARGKAERALCRNLKRQAGIATIRKGRAKNPYSRMPALLGPMKAEEMFMDIMPKSLKRGLV